MIGESCYWKDPLLESAVLFKSYSKKEIEESDLVQIEREVFLGFYSIRKLMDTSKISDKIKQWQLSLVWHPNKGEVDTVHCHNLEDLFDLDKKQQTTKSLRFICNQIIHSFIFKICLSDDGYFEGIFFSSDTEKNLRLFFITTASLVEIFEIVGNDYPSHLNITIDKENGQLNGHAW